MLLGFKEILKLINKERKNKEVPILKQEQVAWKKDIDTFTSILLNSDRDFRIKISTTFSRLKKVFNKSLITNDTFAFFVHAGGRYQSTRFIRSTLPYAKKGLHIIISVNNGWEKNEKIKKEIQSISSFGNVDIFTCPVFVSDIDRILFASKLCKEMYLFVYTGYDVINQKFQINNLENLIKNKKDFYYRADSNFNNFEINGWVLKKNILEENDYNELKIQRFDTIKNLREKNSSESYTNIISIRRGLKKITIPDLAYLYVGYHDKLESIKSEQTNITNYAIKEFLENYYLIIKSFAVEYDLSDIKVFLLLAGVILIFSEIEESFSDYDLEEYKEKFDSIFDFDQLASTKKIDIWMDYLLEKFFTNKSIDCLVIETEGMNDIKQSIFFEKLKDKYKINYISKRTNFDYYGFNNLILKTHSKKSKIVIGSGSLNRKMLSKDAKHITLWHGLGWLKKTVVKPEKFTVGTIICSSKYCEPLYREHFYADNALGFGSIQTDILFNPEFSKRQKQLIKSKYNIPEDAILCFFAPTFRQQDGIFYYNFGIDIETLSKALEVHNIYIVAKKHHVFDSQERARGIDLSSLYSSNNGHFILDNDNSFVELVAASDIFITDYSSGIYYALVMNKPLIIYATDIDEYKCGPNGFETDFPGNIPAVLVTEADPVKLVRSVDESKSLVNTPNYLSYREQMVGSCDGHSGERVLSYIESIID